MFEMYRLRRRYPVTGKGGRRKRRRPECPMCYWRGDGCFFCGTPTNDLRECGHPICCDCDGGRLKCCEAFGTRLARETQPLGPRRLIDGANGDALSVAAQAPAGVRLGPRRLTD